MAALFQSPATRTSSTCTAATARGTHVFRIADYSLHKGLGVDHFIWSAAFAVGGYRWRIRYFPDGSSANGPAAGRMEVYLQLVSRNATARALFDFGLVDQATGRAVPMQPHPNGPPMAVFGTEDATALVATARGTYSAMTRSELEASPFIRNDCLIIECTVTVIHGPWVEETAVAPEFEVPVPPPSDLFGNLGELLETKKGADVTFRVKDELFPAHKIVLAMRSPVFDAELYGPMAMEDDDASRRHYITVEDMHPDVFRALLHFIYTDSVPTMDELDDADDRKGMVMHLLVAADRYAVERLKLVCEGILCKSLDLESVAATLALADMHHCHNLKNACVAFVASHSQEYMHHKTACPGVLAGMWENISKWVLSCLLPK